jgi:signal transduction histidine kinase/CheY-like chemotaxis protein
MICRFGPLHSTRRSGYAGPGPKGIDAHSLSSAGMSTKPALLRAEPHTTVGSVIMRDAGVIIDRWAARARDEHPSAKRVHRDVLLDHLPNWLWELGQSLSDTRGPDANRQHRTADVHGDQRWEVGWSIEEVVRDYQLLRIVLTEYLDETLKRPLRTREALALGVFVDDAIAASVAAFIACRSYANGRPDSRPVKQAQPLGDELLEVLGVLGHELRNPLSPLGNAIQVLKVCASDAAAVERVRGMMDRQFKVMTRLVDDLMDLPRLLRAKVQLKSGQVDLAALARDIVDDRREAFDSAGIALATELPEVPQYTRGDASRLSQVIGNLLQNALKFTERGGSVQVRVSTDEIRRVATVSVKDSGIGIERTVLPTIFDPFVQADRSVERSRGGLGLGLALVKGLIELHGGSVRAVSDGPGKGSEFIIELPLIEQSSLPSTVETLARPEIQTRRILVVEDNRDSAESLKMYLELVGHQVTVAHSGPAAIQVATASAPDVVVCDIGLPGMSGHAVCKELKKLPGLVSCMFVALSGHAADASGKSGFDLYLLKPVDPACLAAAIVAGKSPTQETC